MELNRPGASLQARRENSKNKMDNSDGCYIKLEDKDPSLRYFWINVACWHENYIISNKMYNFVKK